MFRVMLAAGTALMMAGTAFAEGSAADGEKVFRRCKACHAVGDDAKNKVGPVLNGIMGAAVGQNPDFRYSSGMQAAAENGVVWDDETLGAFLKRPRNVIDGTSMSFGGLRKDKDIENIIAYLHQFTE